MSNRK